MSTKSKPFFIASLVFGGIGLTILVVAVISFFCGDNVISGAIGGLMHLNTASFNDSTMAQIAVVFFIPTFIFAFRFFVDNEPSPAGTKTAPTINAVTETNDAPVADAVTETNDAPVADAATETNDAPVADAVTETNDAPVADAVTETNDAPDTNSGTDADNITDITKNTEISISMDGDTDKDSAENPDKPEEN